MDHNEVNQYAIGKWETKCDKLKVGGQKKLLRVHGDVIGNAFWWEDLSVSEFRGKGTSGREAVQRSWGRSEFSVFKGQDSRSRAIRLVNLHIWRYFAEVQSVMFLKPLRPYTSSVWGGGGPFSKKVGRPLRWFSSKGHQSSSLMELSSVPRTVW